MSPTSFLKSILMTGDCANEDKLMIKEKANCFMQNIFNRMILFYEPPFVP